ncbi:MAG: type VI secretion system-associated FHA domain protein TagH [Pseudomonadota bacterium]
MSLVRLILEHAPTPQSQTEAEMQGSQMIVGRGDEAHWRIDDPERFVSRKHFVVHWDGDDLTVTDASTGGLFVDGAADPLGPGVSAKIEDGTRLRFGDFVAEVSVSQDAAAATGQTAPPPKPAPEPAPQPSPPDSPFGFKFAPSEPQPEPQARPENLPDPFGLRTDQGFAKPAADSERAPPAPIDRDDPFALDLKPADPPPSPGAGGASSPGGYFGTSASPQPDPVAPPEPEPAPTGGVFSDPFAAPAAAPPPTHTEPSPAAAPPAATPVMAAPSTGDAGLRDAFLRGAGIDPASLPTSDPGAEMEILGARFRALVDGLVQLLRLRADTRNRARVAQTIIGAANVNRLKFAVNAEEAIEALISDPGPGYLDPETALSEAHRDLIDHQLRSWTAMQAALRKMVDKFDPKEIEREMEDMGFLEALVSGGRSANLWQLYEERYKEIAKAAEERFLGEIGADFRDAYEKSDRT